jgi:multiple sugar transport system substrate-binding protein
MRCSHWQAKVSHQLNQNTTLASLKLMGRVICLLSAVLLSGCGVAPATLELERVTITFAYPDFDTVYYEPLVEQFKENYPHITVELKTLSGDSLDSLVGEADVFAVNAFRLSELQAQGSILSLDPFIEQDQSINLADFYPGTVEVLRSEGELWAIPSGVDMDVMYYNRDLFDQNNLPYPAIDWTWDDFLSSALAITNPDAGIYGYTTVGSTSSPDYDDAVYFIYQHGGRIVDDLQDPSRTTFDEPLTVEAVEWYAELYHEYNIAPTTQQARKAWGGQYAFYQGLRTGKVGMWVGSLSERGGLTWPVEWFVNWGMVPLPREAQAVTQVWVEGYAISTETQHIDASWQWILFLSQQMTYRLMPARQSLAESAAYEQKVGEEIAAVARASLNSAVLVPPSTGADLAAAMEMFGPAIDEVVNERASAQEAMSHAQQEAETMVEQ